MEAVLQRGRSAGEPVLFSISLCPQGGNRGSNLLASPLTPMGRKMGLPGPCSGRSRLGAGGGLVQDPENQTGADNSRLAKEVIVVLPELSV